MSMFLWVVRHCESEGNVDAGVYLKTPNDQIGLSARGKEQAAKLGEILRSKCWCKVGGKPGDPDTVIKKVKAKTCNSPEPQSTSETQ
jgi:broad specificity phosphatase PhoE